MNLKNLDKMSLWPNTAALSGLRRFLIMLLLYTVSGCSVVQIVDTLGPEAQVLRKGEKQFALGNYEKARVLFKEVYTSDIAPQTKNAALYNLACTKIVLAKNDKQFSYAVQLLEKWQKTYRGGLYVEDPTLMITALEKRVGIIQKDKNLALKREKQNKTVISKQKQKISEMKNILQTLQHQITELEAIDQQIQEKKNPS